MVKMVTFPFLSTVNDFRPLPRLFDRGQTLSSIPSPFGKADISVECIGSRNPAIGGQTPLQIQSLLQDGRYLFSVCFLTLTFSDRKNYL